MINMRFDARHIGSGVWGVFEKEEANMPSSDELFPLGADASEYLTARSELEKALDRTAAHAEEARRKCDQLHRHSADFDRRLQEVTGQLAAINHGMSEFRGWGRKQFGSGPRPVSAPISGVG